MKFETKKIEIKNEQEVPVEILAESIVRISSEMRVFNRSKLKRSTIVTLISISSKVSKSQVTKVLDAMETLEQEYLKPKKKND